MFCIKCHHENTKVINSRPNKKHATVWRRRKCESCGATFTTTEVVATEGGLLSISDGKNVTPFSVSRSLLSIAPLLTAQETAPDDAYWLAMTAYEKALQTNDAVISSKELASIIFGVLERYDSTAALKYALDHHLTRMPSSRAKRPKASRS